MILNVFSNALMYMYHLYTKFLSPVQIIIREHKTNKHHTPLVISLQAIPNSQFCPVKALCEYLDYSKHTSGPLFQTIDKFPISYAKVPSHLKKAVQFIGLSPNNFKGHIFWIGAASCTYAASLGFSENLIEKLSRWNSDASPRYIRIVLFKLWMLHVFAYRSAFSCCIFMCFVAYIFVTKYYLLLNQSVGLEVVCC